MRYVHVSTISRRAQRAMTDGVCDVDVLEDSFEYDEFGVHVEAVDGVAFTYPAQEGLVEFRE